MFFCNRKWYKYGKNGSKWCLSQQEMVQKLEKWRKNLFFTTGSGTNVEKNDGKKCFLQQEVVQMWEKWHEIVFFGTGNSITMGKMAVNNVFRNRKWYKYGKNGSK
jgi:hypothetical protein